MHIVLMSFVCSRLHLCVNCCHAFTVYVFKYANAGVRLSFPSEGHSSEDARIQILITLHLSVTLANLATSKDLYSFKSICVTFCLPLAIPLIYSPQPMQLQSCRIQHFFFLQPIDSLFQPSLLMGVPNKNISAHKQFIKDLLDDKKQTQEWKVLCSSARLS